MGRRVTWAAIALTASCAAASLAACTSGHSQSAAGGGMPELPAVTAPSTSAPPTTAARRSLDWSACPDQTGWQCGRLTVPLDHAKPAGPTITLALTRHPATGTRVGSLLLNPGGPGESGITFATEAVDGFLSLKLVQSFDVIGFDPRGVGESTPVECVDGPTLERINHIDPNPSTPAKLDALLAGAKELAADCEARSGSLLAHVSTVDAAEDMDDIRAALGDPRLTYLGFSYGTLLGATYAHLFPTHVRALALDAAIDPTVDEGTMSVDQAVSFEANLNAFLAACAANGCRFSKDGHATLRAAFDALVADIDARPIPVGTRSLGPDEALFGIATPLYSQAAWPELDAALAGAQQGNGGLLLSLFDTYSGRNADGTYDNSEVANAAINCLDHPAPASVSAFQALAASAAAKAPYFGAPVAWGDIACLYWPVPAVTKPGPLTAPGAPPILVVGSTGDPATPYPWAKSLAAQLGGTLLTRVGEGHTGYPASTCVRADVDAYLLNLKVPPAGSTCSS